MVRLAFQRSYLSIYNYVSLLLSSSILELSAKCTIFFVVWRYYSFGLSSFIFFFNLKPVAIIIIEMKIIKRQTTINDAINVSYVVFSIPLVFIAKKLFLI
jgi:hypothetical protein